MSDLGAIFEELAGIGTQFGPQVLERTRALFGPLVAAQPWASRPRVADQQYGAHDRHRLDVYPADRADAPVLLFVHGGGFVAGDKAASDVFYANVGRYFASRGFATVAMNYRLAPQAVWPAGALDVAAAIGWIGEHIGEHGGDRDRILLLGQSAGASHVASYLFDPHIPSAHRGAVAAAALMSGFYSAQGPLEGGPRSYFGEDERLWSDRSPASHAIAGHPALLLSIAEFDPAAIAAQSFELALALNDVDAKPPRFKWFAGHNHVSTVHGLGLGADEVGETLTQFFAANCG